MCCKTLSKVWSGVLGLKPKLFEGNQFDNFASTTHCPFTTYITKCAGCNIEHCTYFKIVKCFHCGNVK